MLLLLCQLRLRRKWEAEAGVGTGPWHRKSRLPQEAWHLDNPLPRQGFKQGRTERQDLDLHTPSPIMTRARCPALDKQQAAPWVVSSTPRDRSPVQAADPWASALIVCPPPTWGGAIAGEEDTTLSCLTLDSSISRVPVVFGPLPHPRSTYRSPQEQVNVGETGVGLDVGHQAGGTPFFPRNKGSSLRYIFFIFILL